MHKKCSVCSETKDISLFKYQSGSLDKHSKRCKLCLKKIRRIPQGVVFANHGPKWSQQNIKDGFIKFNQEKGHYPAAPEIDKCSYLPSSRQIQRRFGGLVKYRTELGLHEDEIDLSRGGARSKIASVSNIVSLASERSLLSFLNNLYGEICVHEQKKYGDGKNTVDFFVYGKASNFGVEVFNTYTMENLAKNLNVKLPKYYDFPYRLYFVVTGGDFKQENIDKLVSNKKLPLFTNMSCMTFIKFKEECGKTNPPLEINIAYNKILENEVPRYTKL